MERARFFCLLHLGRELKKLGDNKDERVLRLIWVSFGYYCGYKEGR